MNKKVKDAKPPHTPGPWEWLGETVANNRNENSTQIISRYDDGSVRGTLAQVGRDGGTYEKDEAQANARLIAAAPDLLAALKEVAAFLPKAHKLAKVYNAAIAKAGGR